MPFLATFLVTIKYSPKDQTLYKVNHMTLSLWFSQSKNLVFIACPGIQTGSLLQLSYKGKVTWFSLYKVWSFRGYFIVTKHLQWHFALLECRQHGGQSCLSGGCWWPTWELGCRQVRGTERPEDVEGVCVVSHSVQVGSMPQHSCKVHSTTDSQGLGEKDGTHRCSQWQATLETLCFWKGTIFLFPALKCQCE